jgi:hypothetical protein
LYSGGVETKEEAETGDAKNMLNYPYFYQKGMNVESIQGNDRDMLYSLSLQAISQTPFYIFYRIFNKTLQKTGNAGGVPCKAL